MKATVTEMEYKILTIYRMVNKLTIDELYLINSILGSHNTDEEIDALYVAVNNMITFAENVY